MQSLTMNSTNKFNASILEITDYEFKGEMIWFQYEINNNTQTIEISVEDYLDHMETKLDIEGRENNENIDLHVSGTTYSITTEELFDDHTEEEDLIELITEEVETKVIQLPATSTLVTPLKKTAENYLEPYKLRA